MKSFNQLRTFLARRRQAGTAGPPPVPHCPFPGCGAVFVPLPNNPDACDYHRKLIGDVQFILGHLRPVEIKPKGPNLVVPTGGVMRPPVKGG